MNAQHTPSGDVVIIATRDEARAIKTAINYLAEAKYWELDALDQDQFPDIGYSQTLVQGIVHSLDYSIML